MSLLNIIVFFGVSNYAEASVIRKPSNNLGLMSYLSLDDGVGTHASDLSGQGKNGTLTNGPTWVNGRRGEAVNFDGSNDYVAITDTFDPTTYSVSMWVKPSSTANQNLFVRTDSCGPTCSFSHELTINAGKFYHYTFNGSTPAVTGTTNVVVGNWYHVVGVYNSSGFMRLYVNGVSEGTPVAASGTLWTGGDRYYIGSNSGIGAYFSGAIDDVRIYNRELSATEISNFYGAGAINHVNGTTVGLIGHWTFNEGTGTAANDRTGQGNNGTLTNSPTWTTGKFNNGLTFDGSNDYVSVSNADVYDFTSGDFTLSAWVKTSDTLGVIMSRIPDGPGYAGWEWSTAGGSVGGVSGSPSFWNGSVWTYANSSITDNTWHYITMVHSGTSNTFYKDGVTDGIVTHANPVNSDRDLHIGIRYGEGTNSNEYAGQMDDLRIYKRALTSNEIAKLYTETSPASKVTMNASQNAKVASGLSALWSYDGRDISGTTAYDRSTSSRNGTITNGAIPTIGKMGQALILDGTNDYIGATGFTELGTSNSPYSFTGWVKVSSGAGNGNIVHMSSQSDALGWCLPPVSYVGGKIRGSSWNNALITADSTTTLQTGQWYHFAVTWDATNGLRVFINGTLENTTSMAAYVASGASNYIWVGRGTGVCAGDVGSFNGAVDDIRIYSKSLSSDEVKQLYLIGK